MKAIKIIEICNEVLARLSKMDYERTGGTSKEQLIFPNKFPSKKKDQEISEKVKSKPESEKEISEKELLKYTRISEQELRQLFIEEFKKEYPEELKKTYYSIETPTEAKYKFSKTNKKDDDKINEIIKVDDEGQSALLDMCVFNKVDEKYNRILNIEFKHGNAPIEDIAKDVLKLMHEKQNGAFIFLLDNTNIGSLNNKTIREMGVLDKLNESFNELNKVENNWRKNQDEDKSIQIIILSLEQNEAKTKIPVLIHRTLVNENLKSLKHFFSVGNINITDVPNGSEWKK